MIGAPALKNGIRRFICWSWGHRGFHPFQFPYPDRVRKCTRCGHVEVGQQVCDDGFRWVSVASKNG